MFPCPADPEASRKEATFSSSSCTEDLNVVDKHQSLALQLSGMKASSIESGFQRFRNSHDLDYSYVILN
jgi:hypothetical protein